MKMKLGRAWIGLRALWFGVLLYPFAVVFIVCETAVDHYVMKQIKKKVKRQNNTKA